MYHFKLPEIFQIYIPVNKCLTGEGRGWRHAHSYYKKGHILSSTIVVELTLVITSFSYESMHLHSQEFYTWMKFL